MRTKNKVQHQSGATPNSRHPENTAKVDNVKDIIKVLEYFRYKTETTLGCAVATGILRNSITYYVVDLEREGLLQVVDIRPDVRTRYMAKHYSADPKTWKNTTQSMLFNECTGKEGAL